MDFHEKLNSLLAHEACPDKLMVISSNYDVPETERRLLAIVKKLPLVKHQIGSSIRGTTLASNIDLKR